MLVVTILIGLIENTQYFIKPVVDLPMQTGNLHNDAVVGQTFNECVGHTLGDKLLIIVVCLMADIDDGLLNVTKAMA